MTIANSPPSAAPISADASAQLTLVVADPGPINTFAELPPKPNYLICDRTGFKLPVAEGLRKEWTGYLVRKESLDRRHPQEFVRARPERAKGSPRPEPDDIFGTEPFSLVPPVPPYLSGVSTGTGSLQLSWTNSTYTYPNKVVSYNIYRSIAGGPFALLANQLATVSRTYDDTGLVAGPLYNYYVTAVTTYGMESVPSNQIRASRSAILVVAYDDSLTLSTGRSLTGLASSYTTFTNPAVTNNLSFVGYSPELDRLIASTTFGGYLVSTGNGGTSWTLQSSAPLNQPQAITWSPRLNLWAMSTFAEFGTSPSGLTGSWTSRFGSRASGIIWVPWMNGGLGRFCFLAPNVGAGTYHYSDNGTSFTDTLFAGTTPTSNGQTYTNNKVIFRTFAGKTDTSPDGITYTNTVAASGKTIRGLMTNGTRVVSYGGADADFQYSDNDGTSWTNCTIVSGSASGFQCGFYSAALGKWFAVEYNQGVAVKIATSGDGINWGITSPTGSVQRAVAGISIDTTAVAITA